MLIKEFLTLQWVDILDKLPNDGDYVYFQLFDRKVETGYFTTYITRPSVFFIENNHIEFEVSQVAYWALAPEIIGVL